MLSPCLRIQEKKCAITQTRLDKTRKACAHRDMKIIPLLHTVALCLIAGTGCFLLPIPYEDASPLEPDPVWYPKPPVVVATGAPIDHSNRHPPPPLTPPGPTPMDNVAGCNNWKCQILDTQALAAIEGTPCERDLECRPIGHLCSFGICVQGACQMVLDFPGDPCGWNRYCDAQGMCCWQD